MTTTAYPGPLVTFPELGPTGADQNPEAGPSCFHQGIALMDPRAPFAYQPGNNFGGPCYGFLAGGFVAVDAIPSTLATNNIAAAQVPVAATALTLASSTAAGITVGVSITRADTGATVTGLLAIDSAMTPVSFGSAATIKLWDPTKAIARNLRFTSAGDDSAATVTVVGYDLYGYRMTETITLTNATVGAGLKAFKYIASITPAGTLSGSNLSVGTGDVIGLPIRVDRFGYARIVYPNAAITAITGFLPAVTTSPATATTGDTRGTYALQTASDGTRRLQVFIHVPVANINSTTGLFGVPQA